MCFCKVLRALGRLGLESVGGCTTAGFRGGFAAGGVEALGFSGLGFWV